MFRFDVVRLGALAGLALLLGGGAARAQCKLDMIAELPVTMSHASPMITVQVNGQPERFEVDTGAFYSSITPAKAAELHLRLEPLPFNLRMRGVAGDADGWLTRVKTFTFANVPIPDVQFIVASGGSGAGLIGPNILKIADVEFDLAKGSMRMFRPRNCGDRPMVYWPTDGYSMVSLHGYDERDPHITGVAYVNGAPIKVIFDTGASTSMMSLEAAARAGIRPGDPGVVRAGYVSGIGGGAIESWLAPVASFKVGDEEIRNTRLRFGDTASRGADMLLGADFFLSHRVFVANSQRKLYFTYNGGPVFDLSVSGKADEAAAPAPAADEPADAEAYSRRGAAFAARREFDRALADLDRACALAPSNPEYFYQRAQIRRDLDQGDAAMADLDQSLKLAPDNVPALALRARLRLASHQAEAAAADLDAAERLAPRTADIRLALAGLDQRADRLEAAIANYDLWLEVHSDDAEIPSALNGRCWARALLGRELDKALADCNRALRSGREAAAYLDSRGLVHLRLGQNEAAIADYDAALAANPKLAWSLYGRGLAKRRLGQADDGAGDIAAAIAIDPKLPDKARRFGVIGADGR